MNERLVDCVAQIILAMSTEERHLLGKILEKGSEQSHKKESGEAEKLQRVSEIAEDIRTFEETYHSPLSALSPDAWGYNGQMTAAGAKAEAIDPDSNHKAQVDASQRRGASSNGDTPPSKPDEDESALISLLALPTTLGTEKAEDWSSRLEHMSGFDE